MQQSEKIQSPAGLQPVNGTNSKFRLILRYAALGISLLLVSYVAYRAIHLSFVHDESLSHTIIEGNPAFKGTPNHHPLNTWLMTLSSWIFGDGEFALRLPNLLSFIGYIMAAYLIVRRKANGWLALAGMCLLLLNPFMLEFFGLARGYGLSLCFMLLCINLLIFTPERMRTNSAARNFVFVTFTAAVALAANLSTINFYISVHLIIGFQYFLMGRNRPRYNAIKWVAYIAFAMMPLAWAMRKLLFLKAKGELYVGAATLSETFNSIIDTSLYQPLTNGPVGQIALGSTIAAIVVCVVFLVRKRDYTSPLFTIVALLSLIFSGLIAEHYLFAVNYPIERTALYLFPLLGLFFYFMLDRIINSLVRRHSIPVWSPGLLCVIIIGLLSWNLMQSGNLHKTYTWSYDANTNMAAERMRKYIIDTGGKSDGTYSIANNWSLAPALNYYIGKLQLPIDQANREGLNEEADFIYTGSRDINNSLYLLLETYPVSETKLYARKSLK